MNEDLDFIIDDLDVPELSGKRPVIITVLAILTFVGSGFMLIKSIYSYVFYSAIYKISNKVDADWVNTMKPKLQWTYLCYIAEFLSIILTIVGAILMLRLKRLGFYVYSIGNFIFAIELIWFYLIISTGFFNGVSIFFVVLQLIFPIGFTILYGINFKYFRK